MPLRVGLIGWGLAGRTLHAPFIQVSEELELCAVATSRALENDLFPSARRVASVEELLADASLDVIVIASPNRFHVEQVRLALHAGKHVVCDKPVAKTSSELRELKQAAQSAGRLLVPYQNRRWDGDFRTVQQLVTSGRLGPIHLLENSWSKYQGEPRVRVAWKAEPDFNGPLYDLFPHLIDQAIVLFGRPEAVHCTIGQHRPTSPVPDHVRMRLFFPSGLEAALEVDQLDAFGGRRLALRGLRGSFEKHGFDPQEAELLAGKFPNALGWGREARGNWGALRVLTDDKLQEELIETEPGNHGAFYRGVAAAIARGESPPVQLEDVLLQTEIIEAALRSASSREVITLPRAGDRNDLTD
jgi:predicted dehydrogenase